MLITASHGRSSVQIRRLPSQHPPALGTQICQAAYGRQNTSDSRCQALPAFGPGLRRARMTACAQLRGSPPRQLKNDRPFALRLPRNAATSTVAILLILPTAPFPAEHSMRITVGYHDGGPARGRRFLSSRVRVSATITQASSILCFLPSLFTTLSMRFNVKF